MHITMKFDKNSVYWEKEYEFNKIFVRSRQRYIRDLYKTKGYIYLSKIYDMFGLMWDPYKENICWILERDGELELSILLLDSSCNEIDIDIVHDS